MYLHVAIYKNISIINLSGYLRSIFLSANLFSEDSKLNLLQGGAPQLSVGC